ncbi:hypothetical protein D3C76_1712090 [compost metagenome]
MGLGDILRNVGQPKTRYGCIQNLVDAVEYEFASNSRIDFLAVLLQLPRVQAATRW